MPRDAHDHLLLLLPLGLLLLPPGLFSLQILFTGLFLAKILPSFRPD